MSGMEGKPFAIPKQLVWQAWKSVRVKWFERAGLDWGGRAVTVPTSLNTHSYSTILLVCRGWKRESEVWFSPQ
jgi:hypothetical protein